MAAVTAWRCDPPRERRRSPGRWSWCARARTGQIPPVRGDTLSTSGQPRTDVHFPVERRRGANLSAGQPFGGGSPPPTTVEYLCSSCVAPVDWLTGEVRGLIRNGRCSTPETGAGAVRAVRRSKTSGAVPLVVTTVLPDRVAQARTCRCTPCETPRLLIGRASRICAALLFAADFSLKTVYFCAH